MWAEWAGSVRRTVLWFTHIGLWGWRTGLKYPFWALLPVGICSLIPIVQQWADLSIRIAGAGLQFWGLLYIVIGIARTRQQFHLPSLREHFAQRLKVFPRYPAKRIAVGISLSGVAASTATGTATLGSAPPRDVESRLDALEKNYQDLKTTVANQHGETLVQLRRHDTELETERTERAEQNARLKSMLHDTATGGLDLALYGVVAVFFSTVACSFSQEISQSFGASTTQSTCTQIVIQPEQPKRNFGSAQRIGFLDNR